MATARFVAEGDLRERVDRLLRSEGRHDLGRRVDVDAEPALDPAGDGGPELGQAGARG